jgi:hypothetical protein
MGGRIHLHPKESFGDLLQRSGAAEVYGRALFEQPLFKVSEFDFGEVGFEQVLIAIDIPQMGTQTGIVHCHPLKNALIRKNFNCGL